MKKSAIIILVLLTTTLILTSSCIRRGDDEPDDVDYHTGSWGLEFRFIEDNPPSEFFYSPEQLPEANTIPILVEIRNMGAFDVTNAEFFLTGFDDNIVQGVNSPMPLYDLEGKSDFNPEGGITTMDFQGVVSNLDDVDVYQPRFLLSSCYYYETHASPVVCVDPDPYSTIKDKACTVDEIDMPAGGQGGPVSVTSLVEKATRTSIQIRFVIQNMGHGIVVEKDEGLNRCPFELYYENLNYVDYDVVLGNGITPTECTSSGVGNRVRLIDGHATVTCKFEVSTSANQGAYKTPLSIKLYYGYKDAIEQEVIIRNIGDQ